ncbi:replicative DNA helicase [Turicibacter sanguinis]|uniref:replicative DNA helicase n=1 Tax=Turicibacter sanguinis TaxID=154288 RepID=UPI0018AB68C6|nr:replicative DNA helicase [Turicibacter sanguinis]MCU7201599.1 replicative DNA helicase [Turicibacter sanguinis]MDB8552466.1 replicative DNA helicase [Turicibacter sanguinis]
MLETQNRHMPHSTDAEQAILGAMLLDEKVCEDVKLKLQPDDFYHHRHRIIYEAMLTLLEQNKGVDVTTVTAFLQDHKRISEIGGVEYILTIYESVATTAHTEHYIDMVLEKSISRLIINRAQELIEQGYSPETSTQDLIDAAEQKFSGLSRLNQGSDFKEINNVLVDFIKNVEKLSQSTGEVTGLTTGYTALDDITSGLQNNDLIIVAARPAMGKTAFALNVAQNVAKLNNVNVAIFSLEMGADQLVSRLVSAEGRIEAHRLKTGNLEGADWRSLKIATDVLGGLGIYIDDTPGIRVGELRAKCRQLHQQKGLGLVLIDYLQLLSGSKSNGGNRQQEVSEISRMLKEMARELKIPVIALSQLSRQVESREDKRPMMSDLRESGSIEQDADIVTFLYREDYYKKDPETNDNIVEVIFAKHRNGAVGTIKLAFRKEISRFENLAFVPEGASVPDL